MFPVFVFWKENPVLFVPEEHKHPLQTTSACFWSVPLLYHLQTFTGAATTHGEFSPWNDRAEEAAAAGTQEAKFTSEV